MANNLRALRHARGWSQADTAAALGTTRSQYVKLEGGMRRLSDKWIERAALAFGIDAGQIVAGRIDCPISILGSAAASGEVTLTTQDVPPRRFRLDLGVTMGTLLHGWQAEVNGEIVRLVPSPGLMLARFGRDRYLIGNVI